MRLIVYASGLAQDQSETRVGDPKRYDLPRPGGAPEKPPGHDDHHGWVDKQDQPSQSGRDVLQAEKIQIARQVITDKP